MLCFECRLCVELLLARLSVCLSVKHSLFTMIAALARSRSYIRTSPALARTMENSDNDEATKQRFLLLLIACLSSSLVANCNTRGIIICFVNDMNIKFKSHK